jgi:hypothetical protein
MSGAGARSRKQHGGFAPLQKNSCHSANDPKPDILRKGESIYALSINGYSALHVVGHHHLRTCLGSRVARDG